MACPTEKTMREIPLGISLTEQDNGFILRRKLANGEITAINLTEEEFLGLREAIVFWARRILSQRQAPSSGFRNHHRISRSAGSRIAGRHARDRSSDNSGADRAANDARISAACGEIHC